MKKILISFFLVLGFLFLASEAWAADCIIDLENRNTISDGDQPIFVLTNTSGERKKFFIRYEPVTGALVTPQGHQLCHNPDKGIDLILEPGETARIVGLRPLKPYEPDAITTVRTFHLVGFEHLNDLCGEYTVKGYPRCTAPDFTLQPPEKEEVCTITTNKKAVKPGEEIKVILTNKHSKSLAFTIEIQPPGIASKYTLYKGDPISDTFKPGETREFTTKIKQGGVKQPDKVYVRAKAWFGGMLGEIYCDNFFYVTLDPEKITSLLEVFRPQGCGKCLETDSQDNCIRWSGLQTALGCIPTEIQPLITWFFKYAISIASGIAFLMIIFSAFQMITSSGDPEKLEKAKQMLGSAIAGLLFIIFAVFLLRIIGVDILKIF